jgi:hypothetical protein
MSIDRCSSCGDLVDTDDEPEAYVEVEGGAYLCLCRRHREEREEQEEANRPPPKDLDARIDAEIAGDPRYSCAKCDWDEGGCSPCEEHERL